MSAIDLGDGEWAPEKARRGIPSVEAGGRLRLTQGAQGRPVAPKEFAKATHMAPGSLAASLWAFGRAALACVKPPHFALGQTPANSHALD